MILRMNAIERSLLVAAVRLLERAALGENVRLSAERFIAPSRSSRPTSSTRRESRSSASS